MNVWATEPVLVSVLGSVPIWAAVFNALSVFGHPLTQPEQTALLGVLMAVGAFIGRGQVTPTSGATAQTVDLTKVGKS